MLPLKKINNMQTEIKKITEVLVKSFETTARKSGQDMTKIMYCFMLKSPTHFKCVCNSEEINLLPGITGMLAAGKINSFIVNALKRFSNETDLPLQSINVVMQCDDKKELSLTLRNKYVEIKPISVQDLLKE